MSAAAISVSELQQPWSLPYRGKVAMAGLIIAESAIFTIFVVAYLFYVGKSLTGPTPRAVLETPIFFTICLLSSSLTVHYAGKSLQRGERGAFLSLWSLTILLGGLFLFGTGREWHRLIYEHGLTISTNLFLCLCQPHRKGTLASCGSPFLVLAFCGCGVGRRLHRCLRSGTLRVAAWQLCW
jgi:cytochrome c oxidase subunit 3/cytochrome o ubiquinol oxidase subunit 3